MPAEEARRTELIRARVSHAVARTAEVQMQLPVRVATVSEAHVLPTAMIAGIEADALVARLDCAAGLGVLALGAAGRQALVEVQTMGRIGTGAVPERPGTRTDLAIAATYLDPVLAELSDLIGAVRVGRLIDDPRPMPLHLGDTVMRVMTVGIEFGAAAERTATLVLAIPDPVAGDARGAGALSGDGAGPDTGSGDRDWDARLAVHVMASEAQVRAVLWRAELPLDRILALTCGSEIPIPRAAIDHVQIEGDDRRAICRGRLGQARGQRAVRIADMSAARGEAAGPDISGARADSGAGATGGPASVSPEGGVPAGMADIVPGGLSLAQMSDQPG